jgi:hypothetical protein
MYNSGRDVWAKEFRARRPEVSMETIEAYLDNLYRVRPDFVYSVSRDFVRSCQTPMLVLPDDTPAHAYQASVDIASLAPNAEVTVCPWKDLTNSPHFAGIFAASNAGPAVSAAG